MAVEIEAKMRFDDTTALVENLIQAGAAKVRTVLEVNTYFDTPKRALCASDRGLRLRIEREEHGPYKSVTIGSKGPRVPSELKRRSEIEVPVEPGGAEAAHELLQGLGYQPVLTFEKRRTRYKLGDCLVELDHLPYLGRFVEIEGPSDQAVLGVRKQLGLDQVPLISTSYIAMLSDYLTKNGITDDYIRLEVD